MSVEIDSVSVARTEVVLDGRGARGVNGALTVTSATGQAVSSRVALAAIASPVNGQLAILTESGREGMFVFDTSNLTASITADPYQAIYVAPAATPTGASGAWTRRYSGAVNATWFGALADGTTNNAIALQAWLDHGDRLSLPAGEYYSADNLILRQSAVVEGDCYGFDTRNVDGTPSLGYDNQPGSRIRFAAGKGLQIQNQTTLTTVAAVVAAGAGAFTQEGSYHSRISNLALVGPGTGATTTGLYCRTLVHLDNVHCYTFTGKGFDISASSDVDDGNSEYGNASLATLTNCHAISNGGHGFHIRGRDSSVIALNSCKAQLNGGWGFLDEGLLGDIYNGCLAATNTAGSYKNLNGVADAAFNGCYVEPGVGETPDLSHRCTVNGGQLASMVRSSNVGTNGHPAIAGPSGLTTGLLKFHRQEYTGSVGGAITNTAYVYRHSGNLGLVLQGSVDGGGTYDLSLVNKSNQLVLGIPTGTQNLSLFGDILINGFQVVGPQLAAVTGGVGTGGANPSGAEFNALVVVVNNILTRLRTHGLIAT